MRDSMFYLMHRDVVVGAFILDPSYSMRTLKIRDDAREHLPVSVKDEHALRTWLLDRGIPVTRKGFKKDFGDIDPFVLMVNDLGLSLTDHYWIRPVDYEKGWKDVNLYENDFKEAYSLDLDTGRNMFDLRNKTNFVPSTSLKGDLKKKWIIREGGVRSLVKGNHGESCIQSLSEVLASEIHRRQKKAHVAYGLVHISSDGVPRVGCMCDAFTAERVEFVSAYDLIGLVKKPNTMSYYEFFVETCGQCGVDVRAFLEYQILTDFVISNTDRHLNNLGLLRDPETLEFIGAAPIFDSGNSMFYRNDYVPVGRGLLEIEVTSFFSTEMKLLKQVRDRQRIDISLLPSGPYVYQLLAKDDKLSDERKERTVKAYEKKIDYLNDFMNGAAIWDRKYKG